MSQDVGAGGARTAAAATRALAEDLARGALDAVAAADAVHWEGLAATAARASARAGADRLDRTVLALLDAADALDRHADAVASPGVRDWWPW